MTVLLYLMIFCLIAIIVYLIVVIKRREGNYKEIEARVLHFIKEQEKRDTRLRNEIAYDIQKPKDTFEREYLDRIASEVKLMKIEVDYLSKIEKNTHSRIALLDKNFTLVTRDHVLLKEIVESMIKMAKDSRK